MTMAIALTKDNNDNDNNNDDDNDNNNDNTVSHRLWHASSPSLWARHALGPYLTISSRLSSLQGGFGGSMRTTAQGQQHKDNSTMTTTQGRQHKENNTSFWRLPVVLVLQL